MGKVGQRDKTWQRALPKMVRRPNRCPKHPTNTFNTAQCTQQ
jgi:hypothetical protein